MKLLNSLDYAIIDISPKIIDSILSRIYILSNE